MVKARSTIPRAGVPSHDPGRALDEGIRAVGAGVGNADVDHDVQLAAEEAVGNCHRAALREGQALEAVDARAGGVGDIGRGHILRCRLEDRAGAGDRGIGGGGTGRSGRALRAGGQLAGPEVSASSDRFLTFALVTRRS